MNPPSGGDRWSKVPEVSCSRRRSVRRSATGWPTRPPGLGYEGGALVFAAGLLAVAAAYFYTNMSRTMLFWTAFILTRPLGATVGDLLDKPHASGGLALGRYLASSVLALFIVGCIMVLPRKSAAQEK